MNHREAQAVIITAQVHLRTYKNANAALKAAKAELEQYMDEQKIESIEGDEPGAGARFVQRQNRELLLEQMPDNLIVWAAREGILSGALGKFDELPDETRSVLKDFVGKTAGTRYVDIFFAPWGTSSQTKKETARANSTATPPPTPIRQAEQPSEPPQRQPRRQEPPDRSTVATCPDHPDREPKPSKFGGGFFCTAAADTKSGYCSWTSIKKAS